MKIVETSMSRVKNVNYIFHALRDKMVNAVKRHLFSIPCLAGSIWFPCLLLHAIATPILYKWHEMATFCLARSRPALAV